MSALLGHDISNYLYDVTPNFRAGSIRMSNTVRIQVATLPHFEGLALPAYETALSAGMDLRAAVPEDEPMTVAPGQRVLAPTGLTIALPAGYEAQMRPRSGLALKHGITCLNTPGTIDADYRGEVKVILINLGQEPFIDQTRRTHRANGDRAGDARRVGCGRHARETARGAGGFGSTGRG